MMMMMEHPWTSSSSSGALLSAWRRRAVVLLLLHAFFSSVGLAKRHVVYWNSTNTRLTGGELLSIQVNLNDYLDIFCPHYPAASAGAHPSSPPSPPGGPESMALYLVAEQAFRGCVETTGAIKRWECNAPHAPFGPVRFSEKIQRFTPFSLGFEFLPGHHYYYSSLPIDEGPRTPCMKLRVTVCGETTSEEFKQTQVTPASRSSVGSLRSRLTFLPPLFLLLLVAVV